jgi:hypothetical protein
MMLPDLYQQCYQEFRQRLEHLQNTPPEPRASFPEDFHALQQFFQQTILSLDLDALDPGTATQIQSVQIEINKQLRLLGTDIPFLQAARQSATTQQRQTQIRDRITLLLRYCDMLLAKDEA